ncbi:RNA helicase, partial [Sarracenia purpurea var. burkii]
VTELKPDWLVEIAPHYYQLKDVNDSELKKMPRGVGHFVSGIDQSVCNSAEAVELCMVTWTALSDHKIGIVFVHWQCPINHLQNVQTDSKYKRSQKDNGAGGTGMSFAECSTISKNMRKRVRLSPLKSSVHAHNG